MYSQSPCSNFMNKNVDFKIKNNYKILYKKVINQKIYILLKKRLQKSIFKSYFFPSSKISLMKLALHKK